jgi:hypothetical protein
MEFSLLAQAERVDEFEEPEFEAPEIEAQANVFK